MHRMRKIRAKDLIKDIRDGLTASQLMKKYKLSAKTMRLVLRQLLDADAVTKAELDEYPTLYQCSIAASLRRARRRRITSPLQIFDDGNPFKSGLVRDISEKGVCVEGITTAVGDVKDFIIRSGNFYQGFSLVFQAGCRWVEKKEHGARIVAGFEITNISALDSKELLGLLT
jgi:hypothetical protein